MPLPKIVFLSFITLITMVNPLAVIPSFVALTDGVSRSGRARVAFVASMACMVVLTLFLLAGNLVFKFFGITIPAFQIMGGIIFFSNALRTLVQSDDDRRSRTGLSGTKRMEESDVHKAEVDPTSIAVVPLAVPMLSGPGAITSTMVLVNLYPRLDQKVAVVLSIVGVGLVSWGVLLGALPLSRMIGDRGRAVFAKVMALLLGAIGIQFIIDGIKPVLTEIIRSAN
ncbi:MAG: multiple antibiotic resistance protein [Acidobacteriota bacterium]|jgi:multiple antibiotic resistance protein|nr:multiple antibiotic resistance protein [Acidobacteriota bacterium]